MDNLCVEDPGTCPYVVGLSPGNSHTSEYIVATASLWNSVILWVVSFALFALRMKAWKGKRAKKTEGVNMFAPSALLPDA